MHHCKKSKCFYQAMELNQLKNCNERMENYKLTNELEMIGSWQFTKKLECISKTNCESK